MTSLLKAKHLKAGRELHQSIEILNRATAKYSK